MILPISCAMSMLEGSMGSLACLNVREPLIHSTADLINENDNFVLNYFVTTLISESSFSGSLFPSLFRNLHSVFPPFQKGGNPNFENFKKGGEPEKKS